MAAWGTITQTLGCRLYRDLTIGWVRLTKERVWFWSTPAGPLCQFLSIGELSSTSAETCASRSSSEFPILWLLGGRAFALSFVPIKDVYLETAHGKYPIMRSRE